MSVPSVTVRRSRGLRQAASTVFILTTVLPLLIVTWTFYRVRALERVDVQLSLFLALGVALLGFAVFRSLMAQLSDVILSLRTLVAWRASREGASPSTSSAATASPSKATAAAPAGNVAALGEISELRESQSTITAMWQAEASTYLGRTVLVHVRNSSKPIAGTLLEVTPDGVLVEQNGKQVAIGYLRFLGIQLGGA
jgi:hypothetical protein